MIELSLEALAVFFELLIYYFFFHHFFEKPRFTQPVMLLCYLLAGGISLYLSLYVPFGNIHRTGYFAVAVGLAFCYKGQIFIQVFIPFLFQVISMMVEKSYVMILTPMRIWLENYGDKGFSFYYLTGIILSNLTILLLVRLLCSWKDYMFIKKKILHFHFIFRYYFCFRCVCCLLLTSIPWLFHNLV